MIRTRKLFSVKAALVTVLSIVLLSAIVYAHEEDAHSGLASKVATCSALSSEKESCYASLCGETGPGDECAEDIVSAAVLVSGPDFAIGVLKDLFGSSPFSFSSEAHHFASLIGSSAFEAVESGTLREAFLQCATDFNYGCHYGFFESALAEWNLTALQTATTICNSSSGTSSKDRCYHVMGHMFMKNNGHSLDDTLPVCDSLPTSDVQPHCWDGVFMEGVNEVIAGGAVSGWSGEDPLSPCTEVNETYHEKCYENQGKYIRERFGGSGVPINDLQNLCDSAPDAYVETCREGVEGSSDHGHSTDVKDGKRMNDEAGEQSSWLQNIAGFFSSLLVKLTGGSNVEGHDEDPAHDGMPHDDSNG